MSSSEVRREQAAPFLVKLFYRTGAFHRTHEFINPSFLPPHIDIYTWKDATLTELSHHMLGLSSPILPVPAVGTRLCFRLIYADAHTNLDQPRQYVAKDVGSLVLGGGGPGAGPDEGVPEGSVDDGAKTLADARFMTGDYISCAILPPDELTGDVVPASSARVGRGAGVGEARGSMGSAPPPPPPQRNRDYGGSSSGFRGRGFRRGINHGYGRGGYYGRDQPFGRGDGGIPDGEWRRGDRLPDPPQEPGRWGR
ncbi:Histone deacetylase complex subunit SAP18 [Madurella mycetomatis]|uniref:Histone deacetylase complex subunit SAP18 n=1 Tax=Madurella mycetomatis TaxID=100816 RepID=A0A175W3I8_9PEZI|nr:Histone deacetylase complex subunit SAP18 [Madurella mycetomatis]